MRATYGLLILASCATTSNLPASPPGVVAESITVTSKSFSSGTAIPMDFTCDGGGTTPDVTWSSPPEATKALVITFDDVEAAGGTGTRWIVMDVKPEARSLKAGGDPSILGARVGTNDSGQASYRAPCPPRREGHHYALRVIALDSPLKLPETANRERLNMAMEGHVLGSGELIGTVSR